MKAIVRVIFVLVVGCGLAAAAPAAKSPGKGKEPRLSAEARRSMAENRVQFLKATAGLEADLKVKQAELNVLWLADKLSEDQILAKAREIEGVRAKLQEQRVRRQIAMLKDLPPEQRRFGRMKAIRRGEPGRRLRARARLEGALD